MPVQRTRSLSMDCLPATKAGRSTAAAAATCQELGGLLMFAA